MFAKLSGSNTNLLVKTVWSICLCLKIIPDCITSWIKVIQIHMHWKKASTLRLAILTPTIRYCLLSAEFLRHSTVRIFTLLYHKAIHYMDYLCVIVVLRLVLEYRNSRVNVHFRLRGLMEDWLKCQIRPLVKYLQNQILAYYI